VATVPEAAQVEYSLAFCQAWAESQVQQVQALLRFFRAVDAQRTHACSHRDARYVFALAFGNGAVPQEVLQALFKAFEGPPLRDAAARAAQAAQQFQCAPVACRHLPRNR
jgi:hypothetical protein